jgi:hypothetical protein
MHSMNLEMPSTVSLLLGRLKLFENWSRAATKLAVMLNGCLFVRHHRSQQNGRLQEGVFDAVTVALGIQPSDDLTFYYNHSPLYLRSRNIEGFSWHREGRNWLCKQLWVVLQRRPPLQCPSSVQTCAASWNVAGLDKAIQLHVGQIFLLERPTVWRKIVRGYLTRIGVP